MIIARPSGPERNLNLNTAHLAVNDSQAAAQAPEQFRMHWRLEPLLIPAASQSTAGMRRWLLHMGAQPARRASVAGGRITAGHTQQAAHLAGSRTTAECFERQQQRCMRLQCAGTQYGCNSSDINAVFGTCVQSLRNRPKHMLLSRQGADGRASRNGASLNPKPSRLHPQVWSVSLSTPQTHFKTYTPRPEVGFAHRGNGAALAV
eukprot:364585-Chlamydomonas_euryale.AAC.10